MASRTRDQELLARPMGRETTGNSTADLGTPECPPSSDNVKSRLGKYIKAGALARLAFYSGRSSSATSNRSGWDHTSTRPTQSRATDHLDPGFDRRTNASRTRCYPTPTHPADLIPSSGAGSRSSSPTHTPAASIRRGRAPPCTPPVPCCASTGHCARPLAPTRHGRCFRCLGGRLYRRCLRYRCLGRGHFSRCLRRRSVLGRDLSCRAGCAGFRLRLRLRCCGRIQYHFQRHGAGWRGAGRWRELHDAINRHVRSTSALDFQNGN